MSRPKVVILGMLTKIPVGGVVWLVGQYATGFQRLGFDVYYVEAHARTPSMFMEHEDDDATAKAVAFIADMAARFDLRDRWAFQALHDDGRCYGMSAAELRRLYRDAALIVNLHGGTTPQPEHAETGRLVYLGTDPVETELEVHRGEQHAIDFLEPHVAFFTWGLNYGNPDCRLPWAERFPFVPSPPPVVLDLWQGRDEGPGRAFTTIGNYRQEWRDVTFEGETYHWSKHHEFRRIMGLPRRVDEQLELALSSYVETDREKLERRGWRVRPGYELSRDADAYRDYICASRGELTVAKDQNVRLRTGWFSERSATYLAAGRPVVMQDTGFGNAVPTGEGLFAFSDVDGAAAAIDAVASDYERHRQGAVEVAREFFNYDVVLGSLLEHVGLAAGTPRRAVTPVLAPAALPDDLDLVPRSRRPLVLPGATTSRVVDRPVPSVPAPAEGPAASIVVPVLDNLACTRMALESVLAATDGAYEVVVVDNGSQEPTRRYLGVLAARNPHVRVIRNDRNLGFAAAVNQGIATAAGDVLVILNNDTIATPGWLAGLTRHLHDEGVGLVGPVTNRCGNAAEVDVTYRTHGDLLAEAARRREQHATFDLPVAVMFCVALRRDVAERVGPLDERFELGLFEDDDYARRVRAEGYRVVCAEDVLVHHFGEATIGDLAAAGRYGDLFDANRRRFEEKWGVTWAPHGRRADPAYAELTARVRDEVGRHVAPGAVVLVVSKGDDALLDLPGGRGRHFPQLADGRYAGHHPADDREAIDQLERLRDGGARYLVVPASSLWWLDHYAGFARHLDDHYRRATTPPETAVIYELDAGDASREGTHMQHEEVAS